MADYVGREKGIIGTLNLPAVNEHLAPLNKWDGKKTQAVGEMQVHGLLSNRPDKPYT